MDWFADESFWEELFPVLFPPERFEIAGEQVVKVLALAGMESSAESLAEHAGLSGDVLDLCCGPGRHSIELARRGFAVTGVDSSPFLLAKARAAAAKAVENVEWIQSDMREFVREASFDLALNLFTSFGYFEETGEDLRVLRNVHRSLRPGGAFVMDVMGKECIARRRHDTASSRNEDGSLFIERTEVLDGWRRLRNEWILIQGDRARTFRFDLTIYSAVELTGLLETAGFREVRAFGDLDGHPYGAEAKRLVVTARK